MAKAGDQRRSLSFLSTTGTPASTPPTNGRESQRTMLLLSPVSGESVLLPGSVLSPGLSLLPGSVLPAKTDNVPVPFVLP